MVATSEGEPTRLGIVGVGARARDFLRVAKLLGAGFEPVVVARDRERARQVERDFGVEACATIGELAERVDPDFTVVAVRPHESAAVLRDCAGWGLAVLAETPPGSTADDLLALLDLELSGFRLQVAEQCRFRPIHRARKAVIDEGRLGSVSFVHSSAAHGYHGVRLARDLLGAGTEQVTVSARSLGTPLWYEGPPGETAPPQLYPAAEPTPQLVPSSTVVAVLEFDSGAAVYEFSFDQYFSSRRRERLLVRGDRGDMIDEHVVGGPGDSQVSSALQRVDTGVGHQVAPATHLGYQLDGQWVYRNPYPVAGLSDDDIAVAVCLERMRRFVADGTQFSTLRDAAYDRAVDLAIQAASRSGTCESVDPRFVSPDGEPA